MAGATVGLGMKPGLGPALRASVHLSLSPCLDGDSHTRLSHPFLLLSNPAPTSSHP